MNASLLSSPEPFNESTRTNSESDCGESSIKGGSSIKRRGSKIKSWFSKVLTKLHLKESRREEEDFESITNGTETYGAMIGGAFGVGLSAADE